MLSKYKRICISGTSGTGKTTLANHIAKRYAMEYVNTSSSIIWGDKIRKHEDIFGLNKKELIELQEKILEFRNQKLGTVHSIGYSFVTDRGPLDHLAYYLNYTQVGYNIFDKFQFLTKLKAQACYFDALIYLRFCNLKMEIEDNNKRIIDPFFQIQMDGFMFELLSRNVLRINYPVLVVDVWDWEKRINNVLEFLT